MSKDHDLQCRVSNDVVFRAAIALRIELYYICTDVEWVLWNNYSMFFGIGRRVRGVVRQGKIPVRWRIDCAE